jgi:hypothetical protein
MRSEVNVAPATRGNMRPAQSGGNASLTLVLRCDVAVVPISEEVVMRRIKSVFLVGLMASGQLSGCSDRDATTLPAEPEAAAPPAQDLLRRGGLITFDAPGAIGTFALDINDAGAIVGRYKTGDGVVHGFLRPRSGAIVTIDVPGSSFTTAKGINTGGDIVGQYGVPEDPNVVHGFLLQNGKFTRLDAPGSTFTNAIGINDRGDITGRFEAEDQQFHGFRLRRGTFTTFDFPGAKDTQLYRSNDAGMVVGGYFGDDDRTRLFVLSGGEYRTLSIPAAGQVSLEQADINVDGDVVGAYCDEEPFCTALPGVSIHGFLLSDHGRRFTRIDVPGATGTATYGSNELGDLTGGYFDEAGVAHGFLLTGGNQSP